MFYKKQENLQKTDRNKDCLKNFLLYTYRHNISYALAGVPFVILNCNWSIFLYSF